MSERPGPDNCEPIDWAEPRVVIVDGKGCAVEGPATGLPWGVEQARLSMVMRAGWAQERQKGYESKGQDFGSGLCAGQAESFRDAASELIRWAWWQQ